MSNDVTDLKTDEIALPLYSWQYLGQRLFWDKMNSWLSLKISISI
jgi:hypothetical protein